MSQVKASLDALAQKIATFTDVGNSRAHAEHLLKDLASFEDKSSVSTWGGCGPQQSGAVQGTGLSLEQAGAGGSLISDGGRPRAEGGQHSLCPTPPTPPTLNPPHTPPTVTPTPSPSPADPPRKLCAFTDRP